MRVLAVSNKVSPGFERYLFSCRALGIEPEILGMGEPFAAPGTKLVRVREALRGMDDDELVLFSDCWDVVFVRGLSHVREVFDSFGAPLVFSAEPHFLYVKPGKYGQWKRYPTGHSAGLYRFLNSGAWIGRAGYVARVLDDIDCPPDWPCDQTLFNEWFIDHPDGLVLDHEQKLFASTIFREGFERSDFELANGEFRHRRTGTAPCLIHFGGENRVCSNRTLSLVPTELSRAPIGFADRLDYALKVIHLKVLYGLGLPPYPFARPLEWGLYVAGASAAVGVLAACVLGISHLLQ